MQALPVSGTVIEVDFGLYRHLAIVSERFMNGLPMLISSSLRTWEVREEAWDTVVNGRKWRSLGLIGPCTPSEVLRRARSKIGTKWNLFSWNCEHFVYWASGVRPRSPQLRVVVTSLVLFIGAYLVTRRAT